ncbi:MAG: FAD-dependent oxidoreductase [Pseudomonadota bacterium]|nr:FAD-dependent oxidoreductase [Pseudomonadota bacterium]
MSVKPQHERRRLLKTLAASALVPRLAIAGSPANPDVVIIGAGVAGLEAARTLTEQGITFVLIDANDRIGGRVHTNHSIFDVPFDTHAHWMRASPDNPLITHARANGFEVYRDSERVEYFVGQRKATGDELADLHQTDALFNSRIKRSALSSVNGPDDNAYTALGEDFFTKPWGYTVASEYGVWDMAQDSKDWSPIGWWNSLDATSWFCTQGYGSVVAHYGRDVPVSLRTGASNIDWGGPDVAVTTSAGTIRARGAILTVSAGVLAADRIHFTPALPVEKQQAIHDIDMALMNYIGLLFNKDIFGFGRDTYVYQQQDDESGVGYLTNTHDSYLTYGYVGGSQAKALELESMETVIAYGLDGLKSMLGNDIEKQLVKGFATACGKVPLFDGAYSSVRPGKSAARRELGATLADKLFFSGEATHLSQPSTVNGGLERGRTAALHAAAYLKRTS